jgi:HK97 family phage major capsid protein
MIRANEFIGTGSGATGAGLIGTEHRGDMFVELLRAKMGVRNFTALTGLRSNLEIPVQSASTTAEIKGVNDALTTQNMGVSTITLTPKKFGATVIVGKDLLAQSNPDAAAFVIRDIEAQIARKLDAAILTGSTDPLIKGVKSTTGVQTVAISDLTKATWKDFTKFFGKIGQYDLSSTPEWVMTAADAQDLKSISKDSGSGRYIMEDGKIDGFAVNMAGTIANGNIFLGNWADGLVGQLGGLELIIDPYTRASNGMLVITATLLADVGIRNPEGFVMRATA